MIVLSCPFDWMVTYNNDDYLKQKYKDFYQEEFQITYGMKHRANNHLKKELLVANYDINPVSPLEALYIDIMPYLERKTVLQTNL